MDIYVDISGLQLLASPASNTPLSTLKLGETAVDVLNVWLLNPPDTAGQPYTPAAIPSPFADLAIAGRPQDDIEPTVGIVSISQAATAVITTSGPHFLATGDTPTIAGVSGANAGTLNGSPSVTVLSPTTFSVPVNTTGNANTGGTVTTGLLFSATGFTEVGSGDTLCYQATEFNLNTAALEAYMAGETTLPVYVDIDILSADATQRRRLVMQANGLVYRAIYRGSEGVPASGSPAYPVPTSILTTGVDAAQIKRGNINVAIDANDQPVVFTTPFVAAPTTVLAWLMVPSGGAIIECAIDASTIATTGFTAVFGAATPATGYVLSWLALP
jgi:hypothetical protein